MEFGWVDLGEGLEAAAEELASCFSQVSFLVLEEVGEEVGDGKPFSWWVGGWASE